MTTDNWFMIIVFVGVYVSCLMLLDGAHRAHQAELKRAHREQVSGLRGYIRTLNRERKWLEAELAKLQREREQAQERAFDPFTPLVTGSGSTRDPAHIQWLAFDAWLAEPSSSTDHNGEPTL